MTNLSMKSISFLQVPKTICNDCGGSNLRYAAAYVSVANNAPCAPTLHLTFVLQGPQEAISL